MKGILFKLDMVKAIAEERKTQTRRLDHLKEINKEPDRWHKVWNDVNELSRQVFIFQRNDGLQKIFQPRYRVGEMVYIKEAWAVNPTYDKLKPSEMPHTAFVTYLNERHNTLLIGRKRSSMFMPEWAARYFIKITDVRPERLNDITEEDAIAEGCETRVTLPGGHYTAIRDFQILWDSIDKAYPFSGNYWVWRIYFNLIEGKR